MSENTPDSDTGAGNGVTFADSDPFSPGAPDTAPDFGSDPNGTETDPDPVIDVFAPFDQFEWITSGPTPWAFGGEEEPVEDFTYEDGWAALPVDPHAVEEPLALEQRAKQIRRVILGNSLRVAAHDEYWFGYKGHSYDNVRGKETVVVENRLREHTGGGHSTTASRAELRVDGRMDIRSRHEDSIIVGGTLTDIWNGGLFIGAVMSDDLCIGAGTKVTAPVSLALHGLFAQEERPGTAVADRVLAEIAGTHYEREYGPGIHLAAVATFLGAIVQTQATGFRPLMRVSIGVRNLVPGGGGGGGEAAVTAPAGGAAAAAVGSTAVAGAVAGGTRAGASLAMADDFIGSMTDMRHLDNLSNTDDARHAADMAQQLTNLDEVVSSGALMNRSQTAGDAADSGSDAARIADAARDDIYANSNTVTPLNRPLRVNADENAVVTVSEPTYRAIADGIVELDVTAYDGDWLDVGEFTVRVDGYEFIPGTTQLRNIVTGEVVDVSEIGLAQRLQGVEGPPMLPPRDASIIPPRQELGLDDAFHWQNTRQDLYDNYIKFRRDLKWDGVSAYGEALENLDAEIVELFTRFGGEVDELSTASRTTSEAAYLKLGQMMFEFQDAGEFESAAALRQAMEAFQARAQALVDQLTANLPYYQAGGLPGTTALDPNIDQAKLVEFIEEQQQAAMRAFAAASETGDPNAIQQASGEVDYWTQILVSTQQGDNPIAYSSGMIAYLNNMGQADQAAAYLHFQDALMEVLSNPDYHTVTSLADADPAVHSTDEIVTATDEGVAAGDGVTQVGGDLPPGQSDDGRVLLDPNDEAPPPIPPKPPEWKVEQNFGSSGAYWGSQIDDEVDYLEDITPFRLVDAPAPPSPTGQGDALADIGDEADYLEELSQWQGQRAQNLGSAVLDDADDADDFVDVPHLLTQITQSKEAAQLENGVPLATQADELAHLDAPPPINLDNGPALPADSPLRFGFASDAEDAPAWVQDNFAIERALGAGDIPPGFKSQDTLLEMWQSHVDALRDASRHGDNAEEMNNFANFVDDMIDLVEDGTNPYERIQEALRTMAPQAEAGGVGSVYAQQYFMLENLSVELQRMFETDFGMRGEMRWVTESNALIDLAHAEDATQADIYQQQNALWDIFEQLNYGPVPDRPYIDPPPGLAGAAARPPLPPPRGLSQHWDAVAPLVEVQPSGPASSSLVSGSAEDAASPFTRVEDIDSYPSAAAAYDAKLGATDPARITPYEDLVFDLPANWLEEDQKLYQNLLESEVRAEVQRGSEIQRQLDAVASQSEAQWRQKFRDEVMPAKYPDYIGTPMAQTLEDQYGRALMATQIWSQGGGASLVDNAAPARSLDLGDVHQTQNVVDASTPKRSVKFGDSQTISLRTELIAKHDPETGERFFVRFAPDAPSLVGQLTGARVVDAPPGWQAGRSPGLGRLATEPGAFPFTTQELVVNRLMQVSSRPDQFPASLTSTLDELSTAIDYGYSSELFRSQDTLYRLEDLLDTMRSASASGNSPDALLSSRALILGLDTEMLKFLSWLTDVARRVF